MEYLEKYQKSHSKEWYENRLRYFKKDIYPVIANKPINEVNSNDIRIILDNTIAHIRKSKRGTVEVKATYVRQICSEVMHAIITLRIITYPTSALRRYIKCSPVKHAKVLKDRDKKVILPLLQNYGGCTSIKNALLTALYSMLRTIEIRRAK
ncbi:phage integrase central domain-containing protein [Acinetobacter terrae]|uniref:phage integrase central domain-containing protein n=1 Tax=Acinetobacter terrae TaxID=2731247 RepID=UPI0036323AF4